MPHSPNGLHDYHLARGGRQDRAVAAATLAAAGLFSMLLGAQLAWSDATASWVAPIWALLAAGSGSAAILTSIRIPVGGIASVLVGMLCAFAVLLSCAVPIQLGVVALTWLVAGPCAVVSVVFLALSIPGGRAWDHLVHASQLDDHDVLAVPATSPTLDAPPRPASAPLLVPAHRTLAPRASRALTAPSRPGPHEFDVVRALTDPDDPHHEDVVGPTWSLRGQPA